MIGLINFLFISAIVVVAVRMYIYRDRPSIPESWRIPTLWCQDMRTINRDPSKRVHLYLHRKDCPMRTPKDLGEGRPASHAKRPDPNGFLRPEYVRYQNSAQEPSSRWYKIHYD